MLVYSNCYWNEMQLLIIYLDLWFSGQTAVKKKVLHHFSFTPHISPWSYAAELIVKKQNNNCKKHIIQKPIQNQVNH